MPTAPDSIPVLDVLIIGGGPSGLAAAIACQQRGLQYLVLEKGVLVNSIYHFPPQMVFFTTPELLEIGRLPFVSPYEKPTRHEALRYYRRVVETFGLKLSLGERVEAVTRTTDGSAGLFEVRSRTATDEHVRRGRAVVLAIGYYDHPNLLRVPGEDLPHVSHYYGEPHPFFGQRVVVVGGANSAAEAALELYRTGAHVTLVHREASLSRGMKYWVLPDIQNRIREGSIAARFESTVVAITPDVVRIEHEGVQEALPADRVFLLTGYHADHEFLRQCGVELDSGTCIPHHDPETYETSVPGLFLAGGVIAGRDTVPIFIENGRLHGEKIVETIAARLGRG